MKNADVYGCFGIHPHNAKDYNQAIEDKIIGIFKADKDKKALGWGEIGLDYHYDFSVCYLFLFFFIDSPLHI